MHISRKMDLEHNGYHLILPLAFHLLQWWPHVENDMTLTCFRKDFVKMSLNLPLLLDQLIQIVLLYFNLNNISLILT